MSTFSSMTHMKRHEKTPWTHVAWASWALVDQSFPFCPLWLFQSAHGSCRLIPGRCRFFIFSQDIPRSSNFLSQSLSLIWFSNDTHVIHILYSYEIWFMINLQSHSLPQSRKHGILNYLAESCDSGECLASHGVTWVYPASPNTAFETCKRPQKINVNTIEQDKPSLQVRTNTEHENQTVSENMRKHVFMWNMFFRWKSCVVPLFSVRVCLVTVSCFQWSWWQTLVWAWFLVKGDSTWSTWFF